RFTGVSGLQTRTTGMRTPAAAGTSKVPPFSGGFMCSRAHSHHYGHGIAHACYSGAVESLKKHLEAFQRSRAGLFVKKLLDDQAPNLAALLAWGTLSALLPLLLGVLSLAGLVLRDPKRLDEIYATLIVTTVLLVISTLAAGLGSMVGNVPLPIAVGPVLARVIGWSVSILSVFVLFLLIYRFLPNVKQGWRDVLPGALLASALLLIVSQVFPLYVTLFPPNHAYAIFGVFLLFTFYLYVVGFVFVLGAELNAFLHEPARSVALAEATTA